MKISAGKDMLELVDILDPGLSIFRGIPYPFMHIQRYPISIHAYSEVSYIHSCIFRGIQYPFMHIQIIQYPFMHIQMYPISIHAYSEVSNIHSCDQRYPISIHAR